MNCIIIGYVEEKCVQFGNTINAYLIIYRKKYYIIDFNGTMYESPYC